MSKPVVIDSANDADNKKISDDYKMDVRKPKAVMKKKV
jgi:hypothetical protein